MLRKTIVFVFFVLGFSLLGHAQTLHTSYYTSGKVQATFYSTGNLTERVIYFENGAVKEIATFRDNVAHGTWKYLDETGKTLKTSFYNEGEKTGVWTVWSHLTKNYIVIDYSKSKSVATILKSESRFE